MLKLLINGIIYILLFREIYAVVLYDLYGEKTEYRKKRKRAARRTDRPQVISRTTVNPSSHHQILPIQDRCNAESWLNQTA